MVARFGEVWTGTAVRRNREGMTAAAGMSFADDARMWPAEPDPQTRRRGLLRGPVL